jgi:menaquinone reductase, multiheme cytochrome c subunit
MTVRRNLLVFGCGVALATLLGWVAFPHALYVSRQQPVRFYHKLHAGKSGMAQCDACHSIGADGQFAAIPQTATCAGCHSQQLGASKDEATLVNEYVKPDRAIPWLVYSRQPANVWFSHAVHVQVARLACAECHGKYGESDRGRSYEQDRIDGYSRDVATSMTMNDCEACHRRHHVEVGCVGCHQ